MASQTNGSNGHSAVMDAQRAKSALVYKEDLAPGLLYEMELKKILASTESQFQKIEVLDTYFGKTLITDGKTQSSQFDEFAYHESLVHPSLLKVASSGKPVKRVFIGGGGELATAREVLRHSSVERLLMVDLDEKVVQVCREHLPEWGGDNVLNDSRFELVIGDAHAHLLNTDEVFDVIIMDISDPIEAGPGIALYTKEFYEYVLTRLDPHHGVFVTQGGTAEAIPPETVEFHSAEASCFAPIINTLKSVFDCVVPYTTNIPSFGGDWGFVMAFSRNNQSTATEQEWKLASTVVDKLAKENIKNDLRYYDGETHINMFALAKPLRDYLAQDERIMTRENPIFMY